MADDGFGPGRISDVHGSGVSGPADFPGTDVNGPRPLTVGGSSVLGVYGVPPVSANQDGPGGVGYDEASDG